MVLSACNSLSDLSQVTIVKHQARGEMTAWWVRATSLPALDAVPVPYLDRDGHTEVSWMRLSSPPKPKERVVKGIKVKPTVVHTLAADSSLVRVCRLCDHAHTCKTSSVQNRKSLQGAMRYDACKSLVNWTVLP